MERHLARGVNGTRTVHKGQHGFFERDEKAVRRGRSGDATNVNRHRVGRTICGSFFRITGINTHTHTHTRTVEPTVNNPFDECGSALGKKKGNVGDGGDGGGGIAGQTLICSLVLGEDS